MAVKMCIWGAFLLTGLLSFAYRPVEGVCDGFAFGHCESKLQRGEGDRIGIFYSEETVEKACKSYEEATECMEEVLPDCNEDLAARWMANVQAFDYLCGSARLEYEQYTECYNTSNDWLVSDLTWCHRTKEDVRDVMLRSSRNWLPAHVKWVTCKMLDNYEMCVARSMVRHCGIDAATWQREVLHQLLMPTLLNENC